MKISILGQIYTPDRIVLLMLSLVRNSGRTLEPSCGNGAFFSRIPGCVGIEIDSNATLPDVLILDFFAYPELETFDTIIGNPPYVKARNILASTREMLSSKMLNGHSNLYFHFIEKCIRQLNPGGELIFITPRDFLKATGAQLLNSWIFEQGTITDLIDCGNHKIFDGVSPNCLIWRFEKENFSRVTIQSKLGADEKTRVYFSEHRGQLIFSSSPHNSDLSLKDIAQVRIGGVTGANDLFRSNEQGEDYVYSETFKKGKVTKLLTPTPEKLPVKIEKNKERLIARGVRKFNDSNWWEWGRACPVTEALRVYVNCKVRSNSPFFLHPVKKWEGSVLAIFPFFIKDEATLKSFCEDLNKVNWSDLGFSCDGRLIFGQRSLENIPLPSSFLRYLEFENA